MGYYTVSIFSHMDGDNRTFLVNAPSCEVAAKKALLSHCPKNYRTKDYIDWVDNLGEDWASIMSGAIQSELVLSEPFALMDLNTLANAPKPPLYYE